MVHVAYGVVSERVETEDAVQVAGGKTTDKLEVRIQFSE